MRAHEGSLPSLELWGAEENQALEPPRALCWLQRDNGQGWLVRFLVETSGSWICLGVMLSVRVASRNSLTACLTRILTVALVRRCIRRKDPCPPLSPKIVL